MRKEQSSTQLAWVALVAAVAVYLAIFATYYPPIAGVEDEGGFINQAVVWSKGATSAEGAGLGDVFDFVESSGRHVPWRNPGRSLIVLPLLLVFGLKWIFVSGAVVHVAIVFVIAATLRRLNVSPLYAVLALFHPTLSLYSRTVMGDAPAGLFLALALFAYTLQSRSGLLCGLAVGAAAVMRTQTGIVLPFVALAILMRDRPLRWRDSAECLLAGGAVGALLAAFNLWMVGNPVGLASKVGFFAMEFIPRNGSFYISALLLWWPGMLVAPFLAPKGVRAGLLALTIPILALLLPYYWFDQGGSFIQTSVLGQRLIQSALPVWIVAYALAIERYALPFLRALVPRPAVWATATVLLIGGCTAQALLFRQHQRHLEHMVDVREWVASHVPSGSLIVGNSTLRKLFGVEGASAVSYRWLAYGYFDETIDNSKELADEQSPWFLATLDKTTPAEEPNAFADYRHRYTLRIVDAPFPDLRIYAGLPARPSALSAAAR